MKAQNYLPDIEMYKPPPCPSEDWFLGDTKCYMYLTESLNWEDSIDQCKVLAGSNSNNTTLVSIHSSEEAKFIKSKKDNSH